MPPRTGETFPRSSRLTLAADYGPVFKKSVRIGDDCLTLLAGKSKTGQARLGLAISKKQVKRAVDRNRIKRQIRESFRLRRKQLPACDVVVMVRSKILKLEKRELNQRLYTLWDRVNRKCANF
jgi:ribonuclease P protein component